MADPNWQEKGQVVSTKEHTEGGFWGVGGKKVNRVTFSNGEVWDIPDDPDEAPKLVDHIPSLATAWRATQPSQTSQWSLKDGKDGRTYRVNELTGETELVEGLPTPEEDPYKNDFWKGNTLYRYDEEGNPKEVFTAPTTAPYKDPLDQAHKSLQMESLRQNMPGGAQWEYKRQQDELNRQQREAEAEMVRKQNAWRMASDMIGQRVAAAPMMQLPGQTHFVGFEPNGAWQHVAGKLGLPFNADNFRTPVMNIDEQAAWQQAAKMIGGK